MKPTPGPWRTFGWKKTPSHQRPDPIEVSVVAGPCGDVLCQMESFSREIREANARLIAAAPELLEAVKRIVQEDEAGEITGGAIEDCKQAIEKAEAQS